MILPTTSQLPFSFLPLDSITVSGLRAWFVEREIIHSADFVLPAGKFIAVLGCQRGWQDNIAAHFSWQQSVW